MLFFAGLLLFISVMLILTFLIVQLLIISIWSILLYHQSSNNWSFHQTFSIIFQSDFFSFISKLNAIFLKYQLANRKFYSELANITENFLFSPGLRGAVAFALAIRNTETYARQLMLTTVLIVAIVTVIFNGGLTTQALLKLGIR